MLPHGRSRVRPPLAGRSGSGEVLHNCDRLFSSSCSPSLFFVGCFIGLAVLLPFHRGISFLKFFKGKRKDLHSECRSKVLVGTRLYPLLHFRRFFVFSPPFAQSFRYRYPVVVRFACSSAGFIFGRRKKTHAVRATLPSNAILALIFCYYYTSFGGICQGFFQSRTINVSTFSAWSEPSDRIDRQETPLKYRQMPQISPTRAKNI